MVTAKNSTQVDDYNQKNKKIAGFYRNTVFHVILLLLIYSINIFYL